MTWPIEKTTGLFYRAEPLEMLMLRTVGCCEEGSWRTKLFDVK